MPVSCSLVCLTCIAFCLQYLTCAAENLCLLGRKRETAKVMLKHAAIKKAFGEDSLVIEEKHEYLLEVTHTRTLHADSRTFSRTYGEKQENEAFE